MIKVWMLVYLFSSGSYGQTSVVIDNLPTSSECQRIATEMKGVRHFSGESYRCIEYWKVK